MYTGFYFPHNIQFERQLNLNSANVMNFCNFAVNNF